MALCSAWMCPAKHKAMTDFIIQEVSDHCLVTVQQMRSESRKGNFVKARHLFFYFMREYTRVSLTEIGAMLFKDHATVIHGWRSIKNQIEFYSYFREEIEPLESKIRDMIKFCDASKEFWGENDFYTNN